MARSLNGSGNAEVSVAEKNPADSNVEKKQRLEKLVDELMKDQPNRQTVKKLTSELGLAYSMDPVIQMSTVLQSMNSVYLASNKRTDLES